MPIFCARIPRLLPVTLAATVFCLISPENFARGPNICLWCHLFHLPACPACGTLRALAACFHGRFSAALAFNHNVVITAPMLAVWLLADTRRGLRKLLGS